MTEELKKSLEMLYTARWNVPRAASYCGIPNPEMEKLFREKLLGGKLPLQK